MQGPSDTLSDGLFIRFHPGLSDFIRGRPALAKPKLSYRNYFLLDLEPSGLGGPQPGGAEARKVAVQLTAPSSL